MRSLTFFALCNAVGASAAFAQPASAGQWTAYGHDALGSRYSPLAQITRQNVAQLAVAWTYRTGEASTHTQQPTKFEATPLMVDGTLYLSTPFGRVIALDPTTGAERWTFDAHPDRGGDWGDFANRGVSTWADPRAPQGAPCRRRIYLGTIDARIIALDAKTGAICRGFGANGTVSLRHGLRNSPYYSEEYELTSPPAVINGTIVTGSSVADNTRTNAASGEVRAYDARTGALRWSWDPVPRDSTDAAYATWRGAMAHTTGAANAWSVIAADSARDLVFVPTGSASPDYYGGERAGDNRYANSIVALRASTGKVVWHFQLVHHDLWDYDVASPPALVTIVHDGTPVDVVLQAGKTGQLYVLDRATGKPIYPVEERAVPASDIYGERASPTQPFNTVLPPLSPQGLPLDSVWGINSADREECLAQIRPLRNDGVFTPPSLRGTLASPSNIGGAHWGGLAYDPAHHIAVIPVNRLAAFIQLIRLDQLDTLEAKQNSSRLDDQYTRMHGTPYVMRRRILKASSGLPCTPPPFGALVAIDLTTGKRAWEVPLGDPSTMKPEYAPMAPLHLGTPNLGGPIATAGGVVFIGATMDHVLRAFDVETGRELWKGPLPAGARATPMTYQVTPGGKQFVVVAVGGSEDWGKGDYVVAFALPERAR
ncbi:MAG: Pyrrolo-quinoline quinone beta-propeller repeat-containing protein [Gemmatimonadetes bacterium]|nr:Pyrrolo-quinoline quinone beta-propeller repeat-containing protein [Gemmatimonadota bacterium]